MKRVLIISPHFPPINAADMHRVRQSLPYFREFGWDPIVLAVEPDLVEMKRDNTLMATLPEDADVRHVRAFDHRQTRRVGLGSLALRSLWQFRRAGDDILSAEEIDLVYFSTTAFPVLVLGPYWKRKHGIPYVLDFQDPWHSDYYLGLPKEDRPPKFWFSYRLDKTLEPLALRETSGLISVTQAYNDTLTERYPEISPEATTVIPFGVSERDYEIASRLDDQQAELPPRRAGEIRGVYTGVVNSSMHPVLEALFTSFRRGLDTAPEVFDRVRLHFVGTSYAPPHLAKPAILPIAEAHGLADRVTERVDRIPYLSALRWQQQADFLLLLGTIDPDYVASKLYPYVFARRPILAPFHAQSNLIPALNRCRAGTAVPFDSKPDAEFSDRLLGAWTELLKAIPTPPQTDWDYVEAFTAREMTRRQTDFFEQTLAHEGR
ncbi:MAG: hypothetical protein Rubg2KO_27310 [Rubricoccaceae bacterium]